MRSNQLSYPAMTYSRYLVEIEGLEPSLTEPESVVLPLHHISIWLPSLNLGLQRYECFVKMQNFFDFFALFLELFEYYLYFKFPPSLISTYSLSI